MKKLLVCLVCMIPMQLRAKVIYSVQGLIQDNVDASDTFAAQNRFYLGGMYDFSMWQNSVDDMLIAHGKNSSGFEVVGGIRATDIFRIEANYMNTHAKWDEFSIKTNAAFVNAILDARIDGPYRFFYNQHIVPYVGAGGGLVWVNGANVTLNKELVPAASVMAGLGIEFDDFFSVDLGYRYVYIFGPGVDNIPDFAARAHQLRAGLRMNF